ncbi:MAG TPA: flippase-like domain-containing protein [Methanomicrobiales archaeon]|nr:flippase-like domain-containing protein [Methanomicrobiales archaeon]
MERSQLKWLAVSVSFSLVVLVLVLRFTVTSQTFEYLKRLNPALLVLAIVCHFLAYGFWAMRIRTMAASLGHRVEFSYCLNLVMANLLAGSITPAQAGGEPVRVHQLYRHNVPLGDATAIVVVERVLDAIVLGVAGVGAMFLLGEMVEDIPRSLTLVIFIAWFVMILFIGAFVFSVRNPDILKRFLKKVSRPFIRRWDLRRIDRLIAAIDREVDNFHDSLSRFVAHAKGGLLWGTVYTALFWFSEFIIVSLILMGLGEQPHYLLSLVAQIVIAIIMMIPLTPGSSGVAELSATSIYGLFINTSIVGVLVVVWRAIFYYLNLAVGIIASIPIIQREMQRKGEEEAEDASPGEGEYPKV